MKRNVFNALVVGFIASLAVAAAAQTNLVRRRPSAPPAGVTSAASVTPWTIEITTDGGITGSGIGSLLLTSDGKLTVTPPRAKHSCTYQLTPADLRPIDALVASADARHWLASYADASNPHGCCDMVATHLTLTRQENGSDVKYTSSWYEMHRPLPSDIAALADALFSGAEPASLRSRFLPLCASTPE